MHIGANLQRINEIEAQAIITRDSLTEGLRLFDETLLASSDLRKIATLLTGGPVMACPNLTHLGERMAGLLIWHAATPILKYEAYDPLVRQRFTIAHELGHFVLHPPIYTTLHVCSESSVDSESGDQDIFDYSVEYEADLFASALLMPKADFEADVQRHRFCAAFLAARYLVSEPAVRRRFKALQAVGAM